MSTRCDSLAPGKHCAAGVVCSFNHASLDQEDIEVAIVVVIEKSGAGAHYLRQKKLTSHAVVVLERQTHPFGNFVEDRLVLLLRVSWTVVWIQTKSCHHQQG